MFDEKTADEVFDDFMLDRACQGANFADFVTLLNMKALENSENTQKMEILTEILNDLKLFVQPPANEMPH